MDYGVRTFYVGESFISRCEKVGADTRIIDTVYNITLLNGQTLKLSSKSISKKRRCDM